MRLASYLDGGRERLAVVAANHALPAGELLPGGPGSVTELLGDESLLGRLGEAASRQQERIAADGLALDALSLLAPVPRPPKIVAIGLNYHAHAKEQGVDPPSEPLIFAKFPTSVIGHRASIRWDPRLTSEVDYEVELAVVIGRTARRVKQSEALSHVLGYTCGNDVSARDLQFGDKQWVRGKSLDTFGPMGPVLVTADEIPDPQTLALRCLVNGEVLQESSTADMIFGVSELIAYASAAFTLEPGDVIMSGTPPGVGVFRDPQRFLQDGDTVAIEIDGIGVLENVCQTERAQS
jgi:2-keto-4-pentenoate hydratase/2-oxohepta-3-ene-1,7-dioic acid hydratase in catechol pathway